MADTEGTRPSSTMFDDITKLLEAEGGHFTMYFDRQDQKWTSALTWGLEAPDSPMAAAAAYGVDEVAGIAVEKVLREAGL